jgi:hypothetical protein
VRGSFFHLTEVGATALANTTRDSNSPSGYLEHLNSSDTRSHSQRGGGNTYDERPKKELGGLTPAMHAKRLTERSIDAMKDVCADLRVHHIMHRETERRVGAPECKR